MDFKHRVLENWRAKTLGTVIIAALGIFFGALSLTRVLTHLSYDVPFALRQAMHPSEALIVFMDDESRVRMKQPVQGPWSRSLHVRLLNELFARGARTVVFDVLFDEPGSDRSVDEQLAAAMKAHGHVVLGASVRYSSENGGPVVASLLHAAEPLDSAAPWGVAELPLSTDGTIRRHYYDEQYTNLAWQAASVAGIMLANRGEARWINYYGPAGTIPHVSYYQVFDSDPAVTEMISNRVVFVGMAPIINYQGSRSSDEFRTPYTRWVGTSFPGVEIQATAFLNLARGDWLTRLPWPVEVGILFAVAIAFGFLLPLLRPGIAYTVGAIGGLAGAVTGIFLALKCHEWFGWMVIPAVEAPVGLIWFSICLLSQRSSERLAMRNVDSGAEELSGNASPQIPDHELIRFLAKGSYGEVWLAKNALGTYRALKMVHRSTFEDHEPYEREFRGIRAFEPISRSNEGFVDILQVGRRDGAGYFYYIMELADDHNSGQTIDAETYSAKTLATEITKRGKIPCAECLEIGLTLAQALQKLHDSDLVHRDIKPANIIFVGGMAKLADIGLVAKTSDDGTIVGTKGFLAPEGPGLPQADIYSLGKTLYEAAMGRDRCAFPELPTEFAEDPELEMLMELNQILLKACDFNVTRRYRSAEKMSADLKRLAKRFKTSKNKAS